jgi:chromosome segregation ATPase
MAETGTKTDEMAEPATPAYAVANADSIDDMLRALKQKLEAITNDLSIQSKRRDALQADFAVLEKTANEVKQAPGDYEKGLPALNQERGVLSQYYETKYRMVTSAIREKKSKVDEEIGKVDKEISDKRNDVTANEAAAKESGSQYEGAKKTLDDAQWKYDRLKNLQKELLANIQKMKDARKTIEGFDDNNDSKAMYVHLLEMNKLLGNTVIKTKDEYLSDLEAAWKELNAAKDSVRDKQSEWENAKNTLTRAQAELKGLEENRIKDILERIKPL